MIPFLLCLLVLWVGACWLLVLRLHGAESDVRRLEHREVVNRRFAGELASWEYELWAALGKPHGVRYDIHSMKATVSSLRLRCEAWDKAAKESLGVKDPAHLPGVVTGLRETIKRLRAAEESI